MRFLFVKMFHNTSISLAVVLAARHSSDFPPSQTPIFNARTMNTCTICRHSSHRNTVNGSLDNSIWNRHYLPFQYRLEKISFLNEADCVPKLQQLFRDGNDIQAKGPATFQMHFQIVINDLHTGSVLDKSIYYSLSQDSLKMGFYFT